MMRAWSVGTLALITFAISCAPQAAAADLLFTTQDFAPFSYTVDGVVSGPAADVIRRICTDMRIDCSMRLVSWPRALQDITDGKAHGIFPIGWNAERARWLHFSPPLLHTEYGFFVRDDNALRFTQNADVKGYTVGVFGPASNTARELEKIKMEIGDLTIDMTPDDEAAFRKLAASRVKAVFSNRDVGHDMLKRLGITNVRYAGRQQALKYHIGFSQQFTDKKLVDRFNATFRTLYAQGVVQQILGRYRMDAAPLQ